MERDLRISLAQQLSTSPLEDTNNRVDLHSKALPLTHAYGSISLDLVDVINILGGSFFSMPRYIVISKVLTLTRFYTSVYHHYMLSHHA